MNAKFLVTVGLVAACVSGCALTTERITLEYNAQQGVAKVPGAGDVTVDVQVNDVRPDRSKVSSKKNGFGMEMAPILATEDVAMTIRGAVEKELQSRGFKLGADSTVKIGADITRFWNDHKTGFFAGDAVADLNRAVAVKNKKGDQVYTRQIIAQGTEPNIQLMSGDNARLVLNRALENGMKQLFADDAFIAALLGSM